MNGLFGESFPYTNFHDLNLDWILKTLKEIKAYVDAEIESIENYIDDDLPELVQELIDQTIVDMTMTYDSTNEAVIFEFTEGGNDNA